MRTNESRRAWNDAPYLTLLVLMIAGMASGQTILGKHPADKILAAFWGQNTNADQAVLGLNRYSSIPLTNPAIQQVVIVGATQNTNGSVVTITAVPGGPGGSGGVPLIAGTNVTVTTTNGTNVVSAPNVIQGTNGSGYGTMLYRADGSGNQWVFDGLGFSNLTQGIGFYTFSVRGQSATMNGPMQIGAIAGQAPANLSLSRGAFTSENLLEARPLGVLVSGIDQNGVLFGNGASITNQSSSNIVDAISLAFDASGFALGTNGGVVTVTNNGVKVAGDTMTGGLTNQSGYYTVNGAGQIAKLSVYGGPGGGITFSQTNPASANAMAAALDLTTNGASLNVGAYSGNGSGLTALPAGQLTGTVAPGQIGTYNVAGILNPTNYPVDYKSAGLSYYEANLTNNAYFIYSTNVAFGKAARVIFRLIAGTTNRVISWNTNFTLYLSLGLSTTNTSFILNSNHTARLMFENFGVGDTNTGLQVWAGFGAVASAGGVSITGDSTVITGDSTVITGDHI